MNRLKLLREGRGLTQTEFGKLFNASQNTVSNWEKGNRKIDNDRLLQFSSYFGVSIEYLLGGDCVPNNKETQPAEHVSKLDSELFSTISSLAPHEKQVLITVAEGLIAARSGALDLKAAQEEAPSQE